MPIQRAIDSVYRATPLLGVLSPDIPLSANTPAAHSEMSTSSKEVKVKFVQFVERYTGWAREQRAQPVCDVANKYLLPEFPWLHRATSSYMFRFTNDPWCQKYALQQEQSAFTRTATNFFTS